MTKPSIAARSRNELQRFVENTLKKEMRPHRSKGFTPQSIEAYLRHILHSFKKSFHATLKQIDQTIVSNIEKGDPSVNDVVEPLSFAICLWEKAIHFVFKTLHASTRGSIESFETRCQEWTENNNSVPSKLKVTNLRDRLLSALNSYPELRDQKRVCIDTIYEKSSRVSVLAALAGKSEKTERFEFNPCLPNGDQPATFANWDRAFRALLREMDQLHTGQSHSDASRGDTGNNDATDPAPTIDFTDILPATQVNVLTDYESNESTISEDQADDEDYLLAVNISPTSTATEPSDFDYVCPDSLTANSKRLSGVTKTLPAKRYRCNPKFIKDVVTNEKVLLDITGSSRSGNRHRVKKNEVFFHCPH